MELSEFYIDDNILFIIFRKLSFIDMIRFSHVNRLTYNIFFNNNKNLIYNYINYDYNRFYALLNMYKYDVNEITKMGITSMANMETIMTDNDKIYYDLRYLFELVNKGFNYTDNNYKNSDKKVILIMIKAMKRCISFSRFETIMKIYNEPILYSLRRNINVKRPKDFLILKS